MPIARLDRSVISLSGEGVEEFLTGIITNSLSGPMTFAALLTPQGKIIADFFVTKTDESLLIDTPSKFAADLLKRIKMYKLRAKFDISNLSEQMSVYALWDGQGEEGVSDPRDARLGRRMISGPVEATATQEDYNLHRLALGIPDSAYDFDSVQVFPADVNMDLLNGVDYQKGCFVGQEVVSRMHRKGSVRKRMRGFKCDADSSPGDSLRLGDISVGKVLSVQGGLGMALIRIDKIEDCDDQISLNNVAATLT